jgi:hypothetical protein
LAGETAADEVNTCADSFGSPRLFHLPAVRSTASSLTGVCQKTRCGKLSDVSVNRDIWPVSSQHALAIGIDLAEGDGSHSGSFEPEAKAADS